METRMIVGILDDGVKVKLRHIQFTPQGRCIDIKVVGEATDAEVAFNRAIALLDEKIAFTLRRYREECQSVEDALGGVREVIFKGIYELNAIREKLAKPKVATTPPNLKKGGD